MMIQQQSHVLTTSPLESVSTTGLDDPLTIPTGGGTGDISGAM